MLEWQTVPLRGVSPIPVSRTFLIVFWFLLPFAFAGLLVFGGRFGARRLRKRRAPEGGSSSHDGVSATALQALAGRLLSPLHTLPYPEPKDRAIREAVLWEHGDLERLEELAALLGEASASKASEVVPALRFLESMVKQVQAVNPTLGYDYEQFPRDRWREDFEKAREGLRVLSGEEVRPTSGAELDMHLTGDRIYIDNIGEEAARDIKLDFDLREGQTRSPLVQGDADRKLPIPELRQGDTCPLMAALSTSCYPPFDVTLSWSDDACAPGERRGSVPKFV